MKKIAVVLGSVVLTLLITTGAFAAKGMLTGADITNGSITGLDVKRASLTTAHLSASAQAALRGHNGVNGQPGAKGDTGATGDTGAKGNTGSKGDTGATGSTGSKGDSGAQGATGPQGAPGPQGVPGPQGTHGVPGSVGPSDILVTRRQHTYLVKRSYDGTHPEPFGQETLATVSLPAGSWKVTIKYGPVNDDTQCWPTTSSEGRVPYYDESVREANPSSYRKTFYSYVRSETATDLTLVCSGGSWGGYSDGKGNMVYTRTLGFDNLLIEAIRTENLVVTDLPDMQIDR